MDEALAAGLSSGLGLLGNYFIQEDVKARDKQRDLNDYKERLKFSNELQQQLLEKKMQLAQQYPEYSHFVTNPRTGAVTGFTRFGAASQLQAGDPELTKLYDETKLAAIERTKQSAEENKARLGLIGAQQEAASATAALRNAQRAWGPKSTQKQPKPVDPSLIYTQAQRIAKAQNPGLWGPLSDIEKVSPKKKAERDAAQQQAVQQALQQIQAGQAGLLGGGSAFGAFSNLVPSATPAPQESSAESEDDDEDDVLNY